MSLSLSASASLAPERRPRNYASSIGFGFDLCLGLNLAYFLFYKKMDKLIILTNLEKKLDKK